MQETIAVATLDYIRNQLPDFSYILQDWYEPETGFTDSLARRLARKDYADKEQNWVAIMWNLAKPEPLSHRPRLFKAREVQYVNNRGDLVPEDEAKNQATQKLNPGYTAVSPDYRYTVVQSVFNLDFIFNSVDIASTFQELFVLRVYMSNAFYASLPIIGNTCIYIDEIAMGEIDKFDRTAQGTLLSLPIDMVLTYPLIQPILNTKIGPYNTARVPLVAKIKENTSFEQKLN